MKTIKELHTRLSYSQINNFHTCPRKWTFQYIEGIPSPSDSIHLVYGSAVHSVLENLLKVESGNKDLELGSTHQEVLSNGLEFIRKEIEPFRETEDVDFLLDSAKEDFERFITGTGFYKRMKGHPIIGIEDEFLLTIPTVHQREEVEINIKGFIDLIYRDENGIVVVDHKTSKKVFDKAKRRKDLQLPIYFMAIEQKYGEYPYKGTYNFTKLNKHQETLFANNISKAMDERMNKRNPNKIYGCPPTKAKREIIETFKDMNDEKKRWTAKSSPLCFWCNYKSICADASDWKPKEK